MPLVVAVSATAVESALILSGNPEIAAILAPFLVATPFIVQDFCSKDPPGDPGLTPAILANAVAELASPGFGPNLNLVKQWWDNIYWYKICGCSSVATPSPPAATLPPGTGGQNTGLPSNGTITSCFKTSATIQIGPNTQGAGHDTRAATMIRLFPPAWLAPPPSGAPTWTDAVFSPNPPTTFDHVVLTITAASNPTQSLGTGFHWQTSATGPLDSNGQQIPLTGSPTQTSIWHPIDFTPSGFSNLSIYASNGDAVTRELTITFEMFCSSTTTPNAACCPPDSTTSNYLSQIYNLVLNLTQNATANPPTGWADAAIHAGISGTGSFQLGPNVTGLRAAFTTIPSDIRITPGTPTFYWSLGFVTPVAIDVPLRSLRTVFATQAMQLPVHTTAVDYTFPPGAVVTLTELVPA